MTDTLTQTAPSQEGAVSVVTEERIETSNDKPNSAHIVLPPEGCSDETPQAYVMRARVEGFPIIALCGFTWVPHRDPKALPVCEECKAIYEHNPHGMDRDGGLPDE